MNQRVESLDKAIDVIRAVEIYTTELKNIDLKELNHFMCNHDRVGTNGLLKEWCTTGGEGVDWLLKNLLIFSNNPSLDLEMSSCHLFPSNNLQCLPLGNPRNLCTNTSICMITGNSVTGQLKMSGTYCVKEICQDFQSS